MTTDPWPLRGLVLETPRLELRPDDDAGLRELNEAALAGVHDPGEMPFHVPWTEAPPEIQGRQTMQFYWSKRAGLGPADWTIGFLVRLDGKVIGTQGLSAQDFAVTRQVTSGSWLTRQLQGRGYGTEMRAAVLQFAFDHLGAQAARTGAFADNPASQAVSRKLGYREDGTATLAVRGRSVTEQRFLLRPDHFNRPGWTLKVTGLRPCLSLLGAA